MTALSTSFSTDTAMKYTGCHLGQIAAMTAPPRLGLRFKTNAAFATNASAAAAMNSTTIARMSLLPTVESMHWERGCLFAAYLGLMRRNLDLAVEYARERKQFRKPIGKFQAISHRIADMRLRLDAAQLLIMPEQFCTVDGQCGDGLVNINGFLGIQGDFTTPRYGHLQVR